MHPDTKQSFRTICTGQEPLPETLNTSGTSVASYSFWLSVPWYRTSNMHLSCRGCHSHGTRVRTQSTWSIWQLRRAPRCGWCRCRSAVPRRHLDGVAWPGGRGALRFRFGNSSLCFLHRILHLFLRFFIYFIEIFFAPLCDYFPVPFLI